MSLYLLRHAKAEKASPSGRDADRPLAAEGHAQAEWLAAVLAEARPPLSPRPDRVVSSPARRALETARPIAAALGVDVEVDPAFMVDAPLAPAWEALERIARQGTALVVGHLPQIEGLLDEAVRGSRPPERFRTGELFLVDLDQRALRARAREGDGVEPH